MGRPRLRWEDGVSEVSDVRPRVDLPEGLLLQKPKPFMVCRATA